MTSNWTDDWDSNCMKFMNIFLTMDAGMDINKYVDVWCNLNWTKVAFEIMEENYSASQEFQNYVRI